jgi:hypothetical protein
MFIKTECIDILYETSATGGNAGSITGGDVYSLPINPSSRSSPKSTGDLVLSPIDTSVKNSTGSYGTPVNSRKRRKRRKQISLSNGKKTTVLNYDDYLRTGLNNVTHLKK